MKRVLVDADSCAKRVRLYLISLAKKGLISLFFAANKDLSPNAGQDQGQAASDRCGTGGRYAAEYFPGQAILLHG